MALADLATHPPHGTGTSHGAQCFAIMEDDDPELPPVAPTESPFPRFHARRGLIVCLDKAAQAYWRMLVAEGEPLAEATVERACERYARNGASA
jgi:hypothetical protein